MPAIEKAYMARQPFSRWQRWFLLAASISILAWITASWWAARLIASPPRRGLQDYHRLILDAPANHGMKVIPFSLADGTPALLCRPDSAASLGPRGTLIRQQLSNRQLNLPAQGSESGATLVLLHGRRGRKEDNLPIAERFCAAGFRCILIDLPAHGAHPTAIATYGLDEASLPATALHHAATKFQFPAQPAGLWGISMGGSVAIHAAAGAPPGTWSALVIVASFDSLGPVIHRQSKPWLGSSLSRFFTACSGAFFAQRASYHLADIQPAMLAPTITSPTLVAHGDDDPLIPTEAGKRLFDAIGTADKRWINVGAGTHGNVLITPHPLYADMAEWFIAQLHR